MDEHEPNWTELIAEQKQSGLKIDEFCLSRGLNKYTFKKRKYAAKAPVKSAEFVEIPRRVVAAPLSVKLRNGRSIEISAGFNEVEVQRLVRVLERC